MFFEKFASRNEKKQDERRENEKRKLENPQVERENSLSMLSKCRILFVA